MPSVRPYLSAEQLAAVTPWSVNAIWKMSGRGMLQRNAHYFRALGRRRKIVFKWRAIVAFIEGREQTEPETPGATWLEQQTGVNCVTLRKHYGRWMAGEVESELRQFAAFDKTPFGRPEAKLFPRAVGSREQFPQPFEIVGVKNWSQGDSNPKKSPQILMILTSKTAKKRHLPPRIVPPGDNFGEDAKCVGVMASFGSQAFTVQHTPLFRMRLPIGCCPYSRARN
jgi:hypothetical protein